MLSIGDFAGLCGTTVKTLRLYDSMGLLEADYVSESGYRYYRKTSASRLYRIQALKQAGFKLREIKEYLICSDDEVCALLDEKLLLLRSQQRECEKIKKEYEKRMKQKKYSVSYSQGKISVISFGENKSFAITCDEQRSGMCVTMLESGLEAEQLIGFDFDDLEAIANGKRLLSAGSCYSRGSGCELMNNAVIGASESLADSLIVFIEASCDADIEELSDIMDSFLASFGEDAQIMFFANLEGCEEGVSVKWIALG